MLIWKKPEAWSKGLEVVYYCKHLIFPMQHHSQKPNALCSYIFYCFVISDLEAISLWWVSSVYTFYEIIF